MRVRYRVEALDDLSRIRAWYLKRNPSVARSMIAKARAKARQLAEFPESAALVEGRQERVLPVNGTPLLLIYRVDTISKVVEILAVVDARRSPESRFRT